MDHLRQAQDFHLRQAEALSQFRQANATTDNPTAAPSPPPSHLFTTNAALRMSDAAASSVLDAMIAALPQDSSRLFA